MRWNGGSNLVYLHEAIDKWNTLNYINIYMTGSQDEDVRIYGIYDDDPWWWEGDWYGRYDFHTYWTDTIRFNRYYIQRDHMPKEARKNLSLHEVGHALGLRHSYVGNIMLEGGGTEFNEQLDFGWQDKSDYNYLWE